MAIPSPGRPGRNANLRALLVTLFLALGAGLPAALAQPTTTVITHGYQLDGTFPDWPVTMGTAIAQLSPAGAPVGTVLLWTPPTAMWTPVFGSEDPAGPLVLLFDWAEDSAWAPGDDDRVGTARAAADVLAAALRSPIVAGALAGTSVLESAPGIARPLHFIGHSRGTTVNSGAVRRLVVDGIAVDHVTTLDPHPIGPNAALDDPIPTTWEGVAFADNYWRADGCDLDYGCLGFDFDGEEVPGAYDVDLGLDALGAFDNRLSTCTLEHILVHTWYHGTIDLVAPTDGGCTIDRANWYVNAGALEGHSLSTLAGGVAMRPCGPTGGCPDAGRVVATAAPTILNGDFEFGAGQDAGWRWQGGGGAGEIIDEPGNAFLTLSAAGADRTHDTFRIPPGATEVTYSLRVLVAAPSATLEVVLSDPEAAVETTIDTVPITGVTGWEPRTASLALVPTGRLYRLRVQLAGAGGGIVDLDDFALASSGTAPEFRRGDANSDQQLNIADPIYALMAGLGLGPPCGCDDGCDANDDGQFDIADPVTMLGAIFGTGPSLPPPFPSCGVDPTPDGFDCTAPPNCP